jgi:hypothetical protein
VSRILPSISKLLPTRLPQREARFGEVTLIAHFLTRQGVLAAIEKQVRFARRRFGRSEVIDFLAVLVGYASSGERTLEAFYEQPLPWASAFMALFGRERLPARSTLSRFLASLDQAAVEALRALFLHDLLARRLGEEEQHTHQWLATFGNPGNGQYREELRRAVATIQAYLKAYDFPEARTPSSGWTIRHGSWPGGSGRVALCDGRQRVSAA